MFRESIEHFARPGPLLERHRRRLQEVLRGGERRVGGELGPPEEVMEHVPHLVEERRDVAVIDQRG